MALDYIIIGQGLAGSVLALTLLEKGKKVLVINRTDKNSSSLVAAGLYNPITGKTMKKTWMADKLFPFLEDFYGRWEKTMGVRFLHKRVVYRPFLSIEEQNDWMAKSGETGYDLYISKILSEPTYSDFIRDPFGGIELKSCGYLDIPTFLQACRKYLEDNSSYKEETFDEANLIINPDGVQYKSWEARKIIYCNGYFAQRSQHFGFLPFSPVRGELLVLKVQKNFDRIFNRGVFLLPLGDNICKVGATYNWRDLTLTPTEEGKNELLEKFNKLCKLTFEIKDQIVGIRPATRDRRPFLGLHPQLEPLVIFNGLGTKGVSLAPYFANHLVDHLGGTSELINEVSINRYF